MRYRALFPAAVAVCVLFSETPGRTWTDSTGRFKTEADMVDAADGKVRLKKTDGQILVVPLDRLCEADRRYVAAQTTAAATPPAPAGLKTKASAEWNNVIMLDSDRPKPPTLIVAIELLGQPAAKASAYGFLKVAKATDNQGHNLKQVKPFVETSDAAAHFIRIDRSDSFFSKHPKDGVRVPVEFEHPDPLPKEITAFEGSLKLRTGGKRKTVTVAGISEQPKPVPCEGLPPNVKMTVSLTGEAKDTVALKVEGNADAVVEIDVVDAGGKSLAQGTSTSQSGDSAVFCVHLGQAIPPDAVFAVDLHLDAVEMDVPFAFKKLKVPPEPKSDGGFPIPFK